MKLSIIVPAYNEEKRIEPFIEVYTPYFIERYGDEVEIIFVINGSTDRTEEVVRACTSGMPQVKVIVEPGKIGKGGAIIRGMEAATGDVVGFADADASTQPPAFQDLVERLSASDAGAVIASRWFKESQVYPRQSLLRRLSSRVFNLCVRILFRLDIWDTQCGAKVLTGQAAKDIIPRLGVTRWAFDVDMLFQLRLAGYRIIEAPTVWHDVGGSQLRVGRASVEMFLAICRLRLVHSPFRCLITLYDRTVGPFIHLETR
ncbi:MAG: glycosyltransferase family 2 protein [Spartobacteria bacterium]|nr:glycosyltransferase family 2 protein [Spartobacteria bacterium]